MSTPPTANPENPTPSELEAQLDAAEGKLAVGQDIEVRLGKDTASPSSEEE